MGYLFVANAIAAVGFLGAIAKLVGEGNAGSAVAGCSLLALSICNTVAIWRTPDA